MTSSYHAGFLEYVGLQIIGFTNPHSAAFNGRWRTCFGYSVNICTIVWQDLEQNNLINKRTHFVIIIFFKILLKIYAKEGVARAMAGNVDKKTWRKYSWALVDLLANLESLVVSLF